MSRRPDFSAPRRPSLASSISGPIAAPAALSPEDIRTWIRDAARRLNTTPTAIAKSAQLAPSTINRFLSGNSINDNLSANTITRIQEAINDIYRERFLSGAIAVTDGDRASFENAELYQSINRVMRIPVVGRIGYQTKTSEIYFDKVDAYDVFVPIPPNYRRSDVFAFEVLTDEVGLIYPHGSYVFCVQIDEVGHVLIDGDHLVVMHEAEPGHVVMTIREYRKDPAAREWLLPLAGACEQQRSFYVESDRERLDFNSLIIARYVLS